MTAIPIDLTSVSFWAVVGTINLGILTYQDYKHHMLVDDRKNYFMLGMSVAVMFLAQAALWYKFAILGVSAGLGYYMHRFKTLGEADIKTIGWVVIGFGMLSLWKLIAFFIVFAAFTGVYSVIKFRIFKYTKLATPFYGVLLSSFIVTALVSGAYW